MRRLTIGVLLLARVAGAGGNGVGSGGLNSFPSIDATPINPSSVTSPVGTLGTVDAGSVIIGGSGKWRFALSGNDLQLTYPGNTATSWSAASGVSNSPYAFQVTGTGSNQFICNAASGNTCLQVATSGARVGIGTTTYLSETAASQVTITAAQLISPDQIRSVTSSNAGLFFASQTGLTNGNVAARGSSTDSATAIAVAISNYPNLTTSGAKIQAWYPDNFTTQVASVDKDGKVTGASFATTSVNQTFGSWTGNTVGVVGTGTSFLGGFKATSAVKFGNVTCSWAIAGIAGSVGVVVRIRNITDSTTLCTCTLGACTATAAVPLSCSCGTAALAGKQYAVQYDPTAITGTDCGTDPSGTLCTVEILQ